MKLKKYLTEGVSENQFTTIIIKLRDPDKSLLRMLECIKDKADPGHSFSVKVDEYESENFGIDGDGMFYIKSIEVTKND